MNKNFSHLSLMFKVQQNGGKKIVHECLRGCYKEEALIFKCIVVSFTNKNLSICFYIFHILQPIQNYLGLFTRYAMQKYFRTKRTMYFEIKSFEPQHQNYQNGQNDQFM